MLFLLDAQTAEILFDIGLDNQLMSLVNLFLAVDDYECIGLYRSVEFRSLGVDSEDEFSGLIGFHVSQCHLVDEVCVCAAGGQLYVVSILAEVSIFQLAGFVLAFLDGTEVQRLGFHVQSTYCHGIFVRRFGCLRDHLTFDIHTLRCFRRIGSDGHGLLETSRTAVRVIGHGDATGLTRLNRLFRPRRSGTSATRADVAQYQRSHTFVLKFKHSGNTTVSLVDLAEVVFGLLECNHRLLRHHGYCRESHEESSENLFHCLIYIYSFNFFDVIYFADGFQQVF